MSPKLVRTYPCIVENQGITMAPLSCDVYMLFTYFSACIFQENSWINVKLDPRSHHVQKWVHHKIKFNLIYLVTLDSNLMTTMHCIYAGHVISYKNKFDYVVNTMRTNLLNWCNLVSISENVVFYTFLVVRIY